MAVEHKLAEQRKFVLWWDGSPFSKPGSPILSDRQGMKAGTNGLPDSSPSTAGAPGSRARRSISGLSRRDRVRTASVARLAKRTPLDTREDISVLMSPKRKMSATIRRLRKRQHMTQADLAKKARVTQGYISQLEAGMTTEPGAKVALRLAEALGVPVTELLG